MSSATPDPVEPLDLSALVNLADFEAAARARLTPMAWDSYASGSYDLTLADNVAACRRRKLVYRVLRDLSERALARSLLGTPIAMPLFLAPIAFHELACAEGEVATARAAGARGTLMTLSTLSDRALEEVCATGVSVAAGPAAAARGGPSRGAAPLSRRQKVCTSAGSATLSMVEGVGGDEGEGHGRAEGARAGAGLPSRSAASASSTARARCGACASAFTARTRARTPRAW